MTPDELIQELGAGTDRAGVVQRLVDQLAQAEAVIATLAPAPVARPPVLEAPPVEPD